LLSFDFRDILGINNSDPKNIDQYFLDFKDYITTINEKTFCQKSKIELIPDQISFSTSPEVFCFE
jgi:hypothetical protein